MTTLAYPDTDTPVHRGSWVLPTGWPIAVVVVGFPLWWALGVTAVIFPLMAIPLALQLVRSGSVRVPPGFWIWGLFLVWVLASAVALDLTANGTLPPSGTGRYIAYGMRFLNYTAITVMLLYVGNRSEAALPRLRIIRWMGLLCVATIVLGLLAIALPGFEFRSPIAFLLPSGLAEDAGAATQQLAQVQTVLGYSAPRPAAPFTYTNAWGNNLSLLLVWFVVGSWVVGGHRRKLVAGLVLVAASIPIVYSLNRGMWIGLGLSVLYVAVRLAVRGHLAAIGAIAAGLGVAGMIFIATPLNGLVTQRLSAGHSNDIRSSLATEALRIASDSPVLGYGSTRATIGSGNSIAVGQSEDCPRCGNRNVGSTGQLWLILIAQGFVGAALYVGYLARTAWVFRRDHSPVGIAGTLVVLLTLFYSLFYTALTMPLAIAFLSIGLLWRNAATRGALESRFVRTDVGGSGVVFADPVSGNSGSVDARVIGRKPGNGGGLAIGSATYGEKGKSTPASSSANDPVVMGFRDGDWVVLRGVVSAADAEPTEEAPTRFESDSTPGAVGP